MEYYCIEKDMVCKYKVTFDVEKLKEIRQEIIANCSERTHYDVEKLESDAIYLKNNCFKSGELLNYNEVNTGRFGGSLSIDMPIYHVIYDFLHYPKLVFIIDKLIEGNVDALYELLEPNFDDELKTIEEQLDELDKKINSCSNFDPAKITGLTLLQTINEKRKMNKNQVSVRKYYSIVSNLLTKELIGSMKLSDVQNMLDFMEVKETESPVLRRIRKIDGQ